MHITETLVRGGDGCRLFVRYCHAAAASPRTLIVLHGACEHGERYLSFARWLTQRGWNAILPDYRGHGRSGGVRTHVADFSEYVDDVARIQTHFRLPPQQTALFGHSTGGLVSILVGQKHPESFSGMVLTSPLLGLTVPIPWTKIAAGKLVSFFAPKTRFESTVKPAMSTRNESQQQLRLHDELSVRSVTAGWYFAMRRAIRRAWRQAKRMTSPLLILQAGQDRIVDPNAPARWLHETSSADRLFQMRVDDYHELLNEPDWEETASFALSWLNSRMETPSLSMRSAMTA